MIFLPEILSSKNTGTGYGAKQTKVVDKEKLVHDCHTRHLLRANLPDHDIVKKSHKICDPVLDHNGDGDEEHHLVKCFVADESILPFLCFFHGFLRFCIVYANHSILSYLF